MKEHFKNYYMLYIFGLIGFAVVSFMTSLIIGGFYVVALVFLPDYNPIEAALAMTFIFACLAFVLGGKVEVKR